MRLFQDTQDSMRDLLAETGEYADLCKRLARRLLTERAGSLVATIAIALITALACTITALLLLLALGYYFGQLLHNAALGFAFSALLAVALTVLLRLLRRPLIIAPIMRRVGRALGDNLKGPSADELEDRLREKGRKIRNHARSITHPGITAGGLAQRASQAVYRVAALYSAWKAGSGLLRKARSLFRRGKRAGK